MQFIQLKRRELLALLSGPAAASPFGVHAQQLLPLIGFMSGRSAKDSEPHTAAFLRGLTEGDPPAFSPDGPLIDWKLTIPQPVQKSRVYPPNPPDLQL
jgi:hypothetical protein